MQLASTKTPGSGSQAIGSALRAATTISRSANSVTSGCARRILRREIGCATCATITTTERDRLVVAASRVRKPDSCVKGHQKAHEHEGVPGQQIFPEHKQTHPILNSFVWPCFIRNSRGKALHKHIYITKDVSPVRQAPKHNTSPFKSPSMR